MSYPWEDFGDTATETVEPGPWEDFAPEPLADVKPTPYEAAYLGTGFLRPELAPFIPPRPAIVRPPVAAAPVVPPEVPITAADLRGPTPEELAFGARAKAIVSGIPEALPTFNLSKPPELQTGEGLVPPIRGTVAQPPFVTPPAITEGPLRGPTPRELAIGAQAEAAATGIPRPLPTTDLSGLAAFKPRGVQGLPAEPPPGPVLGLPDADKTEAEQYAAEAMEPFVPIGRLEIYPDDPKAVAIGKSVANFLSGFLEFAESPVGVATGGIASFIPKTVAAVFTVDMAHSLGQQIKEAYKNWSEMSSGQKAAAVTDMVATGALGALLAKHGFRARDKAPRQAGRFVDEGALATEPLALRPGWRPIAGLEARQAPRIGAMATGAGAAAARAAAMPPVRPPDIESTALEAARRGEVTPPVPRPLAPTPRPGAIEPITGRVLRTPEGAGMPKLPPRRSPKQFINDYKAGKRISTEEAVMSGTAARSIEDLDMLLDTMEDRYRQHRELMDQAGAEKDPAKKMELLVKESNLPSVQLPREALEGALNIGSNSENPRFQNFGWRPFDMKRMPEKAMPWIIKNAKRIPEQWLDYLPDQVRAAREGRKPLITAEETALVEGLPAAENGGRIAILLKDGTAYVGETSHPTILAKVLDLGLGREEDLIDGISIFLKPDGTGWNLQGKPIKVKRVISTKAPVKAPTPAATTVAAEAPRAPRKPKTQIAADRLEELLKTEVPDVAEVKARIRVLDKIRDEINERLKKDEAEFEALKKEITVQRGPKYQRGRIKKTAPQAKMTRYHELQQKIANAIAELRAFDQRKQPDLNLVEEAQSSAIIMDKTEPLIRRLDRKIRQLQDQGKPIPDELIRARSIEAENILSKEFPDITDEEIVQLEPELTREVYFNPDLRKVFEFTPTLDVYGRRRTRLAAALKEPGITDWHEFSEALQQRINEASDRSRKLSTAELENIIRDIRKESKDIQEKAEADRIRREQEAAAAEAEEARLAEEAQKLADSLKKTGRPGGRSAADVKGELIQKIETAINEVIAKDNVKLTRQEDGTLIAEGEAGGTAIGSFDRSDTGQIRFTAKNLQDFKQAFTIMNPSPEMAEFLTKAMAARGIGRTVIGIPGDGVQQIFRNGPTMLNLWKRAKQIDVAVKPTRPGRPPVGGAERPPTEIKTREQWRKAKEYHGLAPEDRIHDWSPALNTFARRISAEHPDWVTTDYVDRWIRAREKGETPPELVEPPKEAEAEKPKKAKKAKKKGEAEAEGGAEAVTTPFGVAMPEAEGGPMVRARDIIKAMSNLMKRPIRVGGVVHPSHAGLFFPHFEIVRLRVANSLEVAAHEMAHMFERIHEKALGNISRKDWIARMPKEVAKEFRGLDYSPARRRVHEGFAEFVRHYLTSGRAGTLAPNGLRWFNDVFLKENPDLVLGLENIKRMIASYQAQGSVNRVKSIIRFAGQEERLSWPEKFRRGYHTVRRLFEDDVYDIERIEREVLGGKTALGALSPSKLARTVTQKSAAIAREWGLRGMTDIAGNKIGPSLREIFSREGIKGDELNALTYTIARRGDNLWERGINPGFLRGDARYTARKLANPARERFANEITEFNNSALQYLVDSGVISVESKIAMEKLNPVYIQFFRVYDRERGGGGTGGRRIGEQPRPTKAIRGGGQEIRDPIENMSGQMERFVSIANKTRVARALVNLVRSKEGFGKYVMSYPPNKVPVEFELERIASQLKKAGIDLADVDLDQTITLFMNSPRTPTGGNIVGFWLNGKKRFYELDPELYRSIMALDFRPMHPLLDILLGKLARTMRLGATGVNPGFTLFTNLIRDYWTMLNQSSFNPLKATRSWIEHLGRQVAMSETDVSRIWRALGGEVAQPLGLDRRSIRQFREEVLTNSVKRLAYNVIRHPWEFAREALSITEAAPRLGEFENTLREMGWQPGQPVTADMAIEAANRAAEVTVNFSRSGTWGRMINQAVAFHNPNIQGLMKFARSHRRSPLQSAARGLGTVTSLALLNWWMNKDDEDWKNMPQWLKYGFLNWKFGNTWVRIPIPFEWWFLYGALPIAALEAIDRKRPGELEKMAAQAERQMTPPLMPSVAVPIAEVWRNRSFYTGKPVEPAGLQRLPPHERAQPYTTETSKLVARILSSSGVEVSPIQIDHVLRGETGGIYTELIRAAEQAVGAAGETPIREPADIPIAGRIFARDGESALVDEMYDALEHLTQKKSTANFYRQRNDPRFEKYELTGEEEGHLARLRSAEKRMRVLRKNYNAATSRSERRDLFTEMKDLAKNSID